MMRRAKFIWTLLLSVTLISGCWDEKSIQDLIYLSAIGIDHVNNEYVIYAQSAVPSSVASQNLSGSNQPLPVIISIGRGQTLQAAMDNLQKNAQVPLFEGFVSTVVFHERILKNNILPTFDIMNRYGLLRYTKWVFGTREPVAEVMSNHSVTGFSPLTSLMHQPLDVYHQRSFIEPLQYYSLISRFWEPGKTVLLPNIAIFTRSWKENNHFISRLTIDGVHPLHRGKWQGFFPNKDLLGLRWLNRTTEFGGVILRVGNRAKATLRVQHVNMKIEPIQKGTDPRFRVTIDLKAFVREMMSDVSDEFILTTAKKEIEQQIRGTFMKGIRVGADLYGLEEYLFKKDYRAWKQFAKDHERTITANALAEIKVNIFLSDAGKMKLNWFEYNDILP